MKEKAGGRGPGTRDRIREGEVENGCHPGRRLGEAKAGCSGTTRRLESELLTIARPSAGD